MTKLTQEYNIKIINEFLDDYMAFRLETRDRGFSSKESIALYAIWCFNQNSMQIL